MTVLTITRRTHRVAAAGAALAVAVAVAVAWQLWPQRVTPIASPTAKATPAWFQPISRYYGNDPRITPRFDFAGLYSVYPLWFAPIRSYYRRNPNIRPQFDFASLYGAPH
jgi:hypothetical protein